MNLGSYSAHLGAHGLPPLLLKEAGWPAAFRAWSPRSLLALGLGSRTPGLVRWSLPGVAESCVRRLTPRLAQPEPRAP